METQTYGNARQFSPKAWLKGKDVCSSEAVIPAMYLSSLISSFFSAKERILLVLALKGVCLHVSCFSRVQLFMTPCTIAHQNSSVHGILRQEYWSGLLHPPPGGLSDTGIEPVTYVSCIGRWVLYHYCYLGKPTSKGIVRNK